MEHPSMYLKPEWVKIIRDHAHLAEDMEVLHPRQLDLVHEQEWFKFFVPKAYTGLEMPLPNQVRLEESLAWSNGSLGWVVTLCSGAGWFGGFMEPELAREIFMCEGLCLAGSGAPDGTAEMTKGGYIVNGEWRYASGIYHATHVTANCIIIKDGKPMLNADGSKLVLPFVFDKKDVEVLPAWKYIGMMATGSHAYRVSNLFVKSNRCFRIAPDARVIDSPLYRYPFLQLAEATLAVNLSGMALHFTDMFDIILKEKVTGNQWNTDQKKHAKHVFDKAMNVMAYARRKFYNALDISWQICETGQPIPDEVLKNVSSTSRRLAKTSREAVDALYPFCGLMAASPDTQLSQVWRDLHTASQHSLLTFAL
ncbi:acyl-CoA dehydrogenase [Mucilaginibacter limnophilus]|uniref:Acyl-CoA dehydrogenase n=1 Tax=Mucilaginibacter limnophilus TaxID=1932778 RepID=A0A3S3THR9_9SPHI|nr:acyl-CoA dehydrogenase [Mucilaginibacter limnophilus]RVU01321.1 acyl-CoA dehydrogenase [Mucilaginibacter limnophilus]